MFSSEEDLREAFLKAAGQTRDGDGDAAGLTILKACGGVEHVASKAEAFYAYAQCTSLIVVGTDICAVAVRDKSGDPTPWAPPDPNHIFAVEVGVKADGVHQAMPNDDPCWATTVGCINAGLNQDMDMLANSLSAHVEQFGLDTFPGIVADLISFYLAVTDPNTAFGGFRHSG